MGMGLVDVVLLFTLTFDSSPIKGEGAYAVGVVLLLFPALWIPAYAGMTAGFAKPS